MSLEYLDRCLL